MIVIGTKAGQLGNRILLFAHFIANAMEYGYSLANPAFDEHAGLFETTRQDLLCRYPPKASGMGGPMFLRHALYQISRLEAKAIEFLPANRLIKLFTLASAAPEMDLAATDFTSLREQAQVLIVKGWQFRDHQNFWKHRDNIREFFRPVAGVRQPVGTLLNSLRRDGATIVGVHIRQGDYRTWANGQYLFEMEEYLGVMRRMMQLLPDKKIRFLICSNMAQNENALSGFDYSMGPGTPIEDMYSLAGCDYIVAPPSTFSGWSSYYGQVPLFRIRMRKPEFTLSSFNIYGQR
jgi:hypothetical protein